MGQLGGLGQGGLPSRKALGMQGLGLGLRVEGCGCHQGLVAYSAGCLKHRNAGELKCQNTHNILRIPGSFCYSVILKVFQQNIETETACKRQVGLQHVKDVLATIFSGVKPREKNRPWGRLRG